MRRKKVIRNRIILGSVVGLLVLGGLFFLCKHETSISREFVTENYIKPILW